MGINLSVQYNIGEKPTVIVYYSVDPMRLTLRNHHDEFLYLQPMLPPKPFDKGGCS